MKANSRSRFSHENSVKLTYCRQFCMLSVHTQSFHERESVSSSKWHVCFVASRCPAAGASLLDRWLLPHVRQHSTLSVVSWRSDLRGPTNTQQLRRQLLQPLDLAFGTLRLAAAQSRHHLRTVQTTAEGTSILGSMNTALSDFWYATP